MGEHVGQQAVMICMCLTHMGLLCGSYRGGDHWVVAFVGVRHNKIPDSKTLTGLYPVSHTNLKGANTSTSGTWIKRKFSFFFKDMHRCSLVFCWRGCFHCVDLLKILAGRTQRGVCVRVRRPVTCFYLLHLLSSPLPLTSLFIWIFFWVDS